MIRLTYCLRRRPDLSREAFLAYWRDQHGPRVAARMAAMGCVRYVQMRALDGELAEAIARSRGGGEPFDGVAELWFESVEALVARGRTPDGREAARALLEDERRFIDLERSAIFLTEPQAEFPEKVATT